MKLNFVPEILANIPHDELVTINKEGHPKAKPASSIAHTLVQYTTLKYMRCYSRTGNIYTYLPEDKFYILIQKNTLGGIINKALANFLSVELRSPQLIENIAHSLILHENLCQEGDPAEDIEKGYIACKNGLLNVRTGQMEGHNPRKFVTSHFPYDYKGSTPIPLFLDYLHHISDGNQAKMAFYQCVLNLCVTSNTDYQVFVYIWGEGGSGKSTFANVCTALVGVNSTHATSLRAMNQDKFEPINFIGMKLIIIGDSEVYTNNLSSLKALTGGDPIRGRAMYKAATENVYLEGLVLITGNKLLATKDNSGAILRRIRPIEVSSLPSRVQTLIKYQDGEFKGEFAKELPGIMAFALQPSKEQMDKYVRGFSLIPELKQELDEAALATNPALQWIMDECTPGKGAFVGFKASNRKDQRESKIRGTLFPAYVNYCARQGLSTQLTSRTFTKSVEDACRTLGWYCKKVRMNVGTYLQGVELHTKTQNPDMQYGAPLKDEQETNQMVDRFPGIKEPIPLEAGEAEERRDLEIEKLERDFEGHPTLDYLYSIPCPTPVLERVREISPNQRLQPFYQTSEPRFIHKALSPIFIETYALHLSRSNTIHKEINKYVKTVDIKRAESEIMKALVLPKSATEEYVDGIRAQVIKGVQKIKTYGVIPHKYKPMGISPRLCPESYGKTINSTKKLVRRWYYSVASTILEPKGYVLVDCDLKSCYISTLMGLFPSHLNTISREIRKGLWASFERDFNEQGQGHLFNKPAVKICTYASLFQGGKKAMSEGIRKYFSDQAGLTKKQFEQSSMFPEAEKIANGVVKFMIAHPFIEDFQGLSKELLVNYEGQALIGPSGHKYTITKDNFKHVFPCYLQSYEIALLAESTNRVIQKYKEVSIVGHYHDGNVLMVPKELQTEAIDYYKEQVSSLGNELALRFPQELEVQEVFKPSKVHFNELFDTSIFETQL